MEKHLPCYTYPWQLDWIFSWSYGICSSEISFPPGLKELEQTAIATIGTIDWPMFYDSEDRTHSVCVLLKKRSASAKLNLSKSSSPQPILVMLWRLAQLWLSELVNGMIPVQAEMNGGRLQATKTTMTRDLNSHKILTITRTIWRPAFMPGFCGLKAR